MTDDASTAAGRRQTLEGVAPWFVERWSPRAFDGSPVDSATLSRLMEAARWSPSCFNEQPWRFYTSTPSTFADFLELLEEGNRSWARSASVLGFLVGRRHFRRNGKENTSFALDCGSAWMAMSLQARMEGLYTHGMAGIRRAEVARYLELDQDEETVLIGFAIGRRAAPDQLPDGLRDKEFPSARDPLDQIWQSL